MRARVRIQGRAEHGYRVQVRKWLFWRTVTVGAAGWAVPWQTDSYDAATTEAAAQIERLARARRHKPLDLADRARHRPS